ncbi:TolC family protein [Acidovorax lacteus]|uniref:TolC family protein n=2 Tax=Acidovorax lacteus TaxID=1924988 RepID=A0ABP8KWR7_9BURK
MNRYPIATPMRRRSVARPLRIALASLAAVALTGCATVAPDGLRSQVASHTAGRTAGVAAALPATDPAARAAAQQQIQAWLAEPLTADRAVRIALLQNPGLQARLAGLGMADAERVQALTLPNPHLSLARLVSPHEREIERSLAFGLLDWITLPWRSRWLGQQMEAATLEAAQDAVRLAAQARRAWVRAVAAEQVVAAHERMHEAAEAGAELARRMAQVGNWSRLKHAQEQTVLADAAAQLARARLAAALEREQLHQVLGIWGPATAYRLADRLPDLPATPQAADALETTALRERLDVRAARLQLDTDAERAGWARASAVFGDIGLAYQRHTKTARDGSHPEVTRGWELELPLPLFDWGSAARTRAQAQVERQAAMLQSTALQARTEVRSAWLTYRTAYDLARQQREEVVPLRQLIADETTLRYNGMLASVWDLLAAARASTQAVAQATEAQRDFWLAEADLQLALTGTSGAALSRLAPAAGGTADAGKGH